jgi:hypothetical protein
LAMARLVGFPQSVNPARPPRHVCRQIGERISQRYHRGITPAVSPQVSRALAQFLRIGQRLQRRRAPEGIMLRPVIDQRLDIADTITRFLKLLPLLGRHRLHHPRQNRPRERQLFQPSDQTFEVINRYGLLCDNQERLSRDQCDRQRRLYGRA